MAKHDSDGRGGGGFSTGKYNSNKNVDELDSKILDILNKNARTSMRDIAKKIGAKPSTVHVRVQELLKKGIIRHFTIRTDPQVMGKNLTAFVLLKSDGVISEKSFAQSSIQEVYKITGEYDLLIKIRCKNLPEFTNIIEDFKKKYKGNAMVTMLATANIKEE